jgi:ribosomal protein L37AE/L43A
MSALVDLITKAAELSDKFRNTELKELLVNARIKALEIAEENLSLREELLRLRTAAQNKETLVFEYGVYWRKTESAEPEGPFCPKCFDGDGKVVRLDASARDYWVCRVCQNTWENPKFSEPGAGGSSGQDTWRPI